MELNEKVGYLYTVFELPERSIQVGGLYHSLIKQSENVDAEVATMSLETAIEAWSDYSRQLQGENDELRETARLLVESTI